MTTAFGHLIDKLSFALGTFLRGKSLTSKQANFADNTVDKTNWTSSKGVVKRNKNRGQKDMEWVFLPQSLGSASKTAKLGLPLLPA